MARGFLTAALRAFRPICAAGSLLDAGIPDTHFGEAVCLFFLVLVKISDDEPPDFLDWVDVSAGVNPEEGGEYIDVE